MPAEVGVRLPTEDEIASLAGSELDELLLALERLVAPSKRRSSV
jgi:hypothetical protein